MEGQLLFMKLMVKFLRNFVNQLLNMGIFENEINLKLNKWY